MGLDKRRRGWGSFFPALLWCVVVALYPAVPVRGDEGGRVLTLEDCLALAETHHPDLAGADAGTLAERWRLSLAAVEDRLQISGSASAARSGREGMPSGGSTAVGGTASLRILDSNRTKYAIEAQRKTLSAAEAEGRRTRLRVRTGVRAAYGDLLLAGEVCGQRRASVNAFARHLERARGHYAAGLRPKSDVTKAEVNLGNAQLALVEAESGVELARAALLNAVGVDAVGPFEVRAADRALPEREMAEDVAGLLALEHRQDYAAAELRVLSARAEARAAARASAPNLSLRGGYGAAGTDLSSLESEWNVGLALTVPIVDGGSAAARSGVARARVRSLEAARVALRQTILLEVRRAVLNIRNARERIRIAELTVVQAEENCALAEGRYQIGVGDSLELSDALLALTEARLAVCRARYDLQMAQIALERATGVELTEMGAQE